MFEQCGMINLIINALDDVNTNALLAAARVLAAGADMQAAIRAGNVVLIEAGRNPVPLETLAMP